MRSRCKESWRLFWRLCDLYLLTIDQARLPRDWSLYHRALAACRVHYDTCPLCRFSTISYEAEALNKSYEVQIPPSDSLSG